MKIDRQRAILKIISESDIATQEELIRKLNDRGYETTQATISRDIREMGLRKKPGEFGRQRYVLEVRTREISRYNDSTSYDQILASGITGFEQAGNILVIKTYSGVAMAVGAAIDNMNLEGVAGCIAGDDTVFVAIRDISLVKDIEKSLSKYVD